MNMTSSSWTLALVAAILSMSHCVSTLSFTHDLQIRYFTDGRLVCDHPDINVTEREDLESLSWLLPDASLITPNFNPDPQLYSLSDYVSPNGRRYRGYNLTVLEVNDEAFGYYWCIVTISPTSGRVGSKSILAIRWGLNVDGADFSELLDNYRSHAIIGGIAAGVVLVLIGVFCLVWYYWCNGKLPEDVEENQTEEGETKKADPATFQNTAFEGEKVETHNENQKENSNESEARL